MSKEKMNPYSVELKARAVTWALESEQPIAQTARDLAMNESTMHTWIAQYQDGGHGTQGRGSAEHLYDELQRLKQEHAVFREERAILTKAAASVAVNSRYSPPG